MSQVWHKEMVIMSGIEEFLHDLEIRGCEIKYVMMWGNRFIVLWKEADL